MGNLVIENKPDPSGTIRELYEGRDLPGVPVRLMDDLVECETLGDTS